MSEEPKKKTRRGGRKAGTIIHYVDPVLKIMRKVAKSDPPKKGKNGRIPVNSREKGLLGMYRQMQIDEPTKFLAQLAKLESEHTRAVNENKSKLGRMADGGSDRCIGLVEELLERMKGGK